MSLINFLAIIVLAACMAGCTGAPPPPPTLVDVPCTSTLATQYNLRLEKQTTGDFVTGAASSYGVAMGDVNNDGWDDVVVANWGATKAIGLVNWTKRSRYHIFIQWYAVWSDA